MLLGSKLVAVSISVLGVALLAPDSRAQDHGIGPGDVALIAWDDNGGAQSLFSFVALEPIPAGTRLFFTNKRPGATSSTDSTGRTRAR
jgi:hypothetical protein